MVALSPWLPFPRGCPFPVVALSPWLPLRTCPRSCDRTVDTGRARGHRPNQTSETIAQIP
ncbi:MAG: hypothetical protein VKJ64_17540 [Leptolyngbyaceae bacterium]|nr:hypothetical protein [Leptolyngbyaceae bacterium]